MRSSEIIRAGSWSGPKIETAPTIEQQELKRILGLSRGGIVVLSADSVILAEDAAWNEIARAPCAVLLVR